GEWSVRKKAKFDCFTILFLILFLGILLYGAYQSTSYSLQYNERSATAWRPYMWPIKITMCVAIVMMLLQAFAELFKDIARLRGTEIGASLPETESGGDKS
ncbi:MAG: TRAP transporter small permease subunit, partial [Alphaproteobacteria bacterium]